jgi:hypothetical protein
MLADTDVFGAEADEIDPALHRLQPGLELGRALLRLDEVLDLHLLELEQAEDEVAGRDLVAERLPDLADAERQLLPRGREDVLVLHEDTLRRLRPQVDLRAGFRDWADRRAEHHVELAGIGQRAVAAVRAREIGLAQDRAHFLRRLRRRIGDPELLFQHMIRPEARLARPAVDQGIVEVHDVAGSFPDTRMHQDAGVEPDHVAATLDKRLPPELLDVVAQLDAQRTEVPRIGEAAIDVGSGKDEATALGERDDLFHRGRTLRFRLLDHSDSASSKMVRQCQRIATKATVILSL